MQYEVRALSPENLIVKLTLEARDEAEVRQQLQARGLHAAAIAPAYKPGAMLAGLGLRKGGQARLSLLLFSQELLALLSAGLSIVECMEALLEKETSAPVRAVISQLLAGLREGKRFSSVLAEQRGLFPPLFVGIVRAAENTSDLPRALSRYIAYRERLDGMRGKLVSAAIYPAILIVVGTLVTGFLVGYVVPRFAEVYRDAGRTLPGMSRFLLELGQFISRHAAAHAIAALLAALLLYLSLRRGAGRGGLLRQLARIPGIGERLRILALSRMYLTMGMLLEGGISIVATIDTVQATVGPELRSRLVAAGAQIEAGLPLSAAFESHGLTTPVSLRMLRVGERSGELGRMLTQSANFYDGEIGRWLDRFMRMFEPLLMAAIGLVVGVIVVLLYMPIFDLAGGLT
jgi:general secretion pathway protein F